MENIELVIKILKEDFEIMKHNIAVNNPLCPLSQEEIVSKVANGIPLPEGHGDLIDISKLPVTTAYFGISDKPTKVVNYNCILNAKKIIKADKAEGRK